MSDNKETSEMLLIRFLDGRAKLTDEALEDLMDQVDDAREKKIQNEGREAHPSSLPPDDSTYEVSVDEVRSLLCGEKVMVLPRCATAGAVFIKAESAVFDMKESGGKKVSGSPFLTLELTEVETRALLHAIEIGLTVSRKGDLHKSLPALGSTIYPGGASEVSAVRRVTKKMRAMFAHGFWYKVTAEEAGVSPKEGGS